jgi:hypothetical protein
VADAATISSDGKLNILGEFNCIWASNTPVTWPRMMYVARIELEPDDPKELDIQLSLLNPDSALVGPVIQLQGSLQGGGPIGTGGTAPVVLQVDGATFPEFGSYHFEMRVGGIQRARTYIHVLERPKPGPKAA